MTETKLDLVEAAEAVRGLCYRELATDGVEPQELIGLRAAIEAERERREKTLEALRLAHAYITGKQPPPGIDDEKFGQCASLACHAALARYREAGR